VTTGIIYAESRFNKKCPSGPVCLQPFCSKYVINYVYCSLFSFVTLHVYCLFHWLYVELIVMYATVLNTTKVTGLCCLVHCSSVHCHSQLKAQNDDAPCTYVCQPACCYGVRMFASLHVVTAFICLPTFMLLQRLCVCQPACCYNVHMFASQHVVTAFICWPACMLLQRSYACQPACCYSVHMFANLHVVTTFMCMPACTLLQRSYVCQPACCYSVHVFASLNVVTAFICLPACMLLQR
jgi:hypothetical protein